jgi:hypothetical protein
VVAFHDHLTTIQEKELTLTRRFYGGLCALTGALLVAIGAIVGPTLASGAVPGPVGDGPMLFESGSYTPTLDMTNCPNGTATANVARWSRVGDVVTVSGGIGLGSSVDASSCQIYFNTPAPGTSNFTSSAQAGGVTTSIVSGSTINAGVIQSVSGTDDVRLWVYTRNTSGVQGGYLYTFQYEAL